MKRKIKYGICLGLLAMLALGGCGKKRTDLVEVALITDGQEIGNGGIYDSVWSGMEAYENKGKRKCGYYVPDNRSEDGYENAIARAADKGAEVVICVGEEMEQAVFEAQRAYRNIRFLLLDGVPRNEKGQEKLRGNTVSVEIEAEQAGYLAGYAAVEAGYTQLGYLGGEDQKRSEAFGAGFALGAEAASKEKKLAVGDVTLRYQYRGTDQASPEFYNQVFAWYQQGCQVIFTSGGSFENVVIGAAENSGGAVIQNGAQTDSSHVVMQVRMEYGTVIENMLKDIDKDAFEGRKKILLGVKEGGASLSWNSDVLSAFTGEQYSGLCSRMALDDFSLKKGDALKDPENFGIETVRITGEN